MILWIVTLTTSKQSRSVLQVNTIRFQSNSYRILTISLHSYQPEYSCVFCCLLSSKLSVCSCHFANKQGKFMSILYFILEHLNNKQLLSTSVNMPTKRPVEMLKYDQIDNTCSFDIFAKNGNYKLQALSTTKSTKNNVQGWWMHTNYSDSLRIWLEMICSDSLTWLLIWKQLK